MVDRLVNSEANARRIQNVESCFGSSGQPLEIPGRVLVGEGVLVKMCRKKPKPRQFFLFNDTLVYGNIVISKRKYNKQHIIPLEEVQLENLDDDGDLRNGWLVKTRSKSFAVYAATATEKSEWMSHINRCVEDSLSKSGKQRVTDHAAVWVPDDQAPVCMHCKKTQFNLLQRRHHCRKCGAVVCAACSSKRYMLPTQSKMPLRVCLTCYDNLMKGRTSFGDHSQNGAHMREPKSDSSGEEDSEDDDENPQGAQNNLGPEEDIGNAGYRKNLKISDKPNMTTLGNP